LKYFTVYRWEQTTVTQEEISEKSLVISVMHLRPCHRQWPYSILSDVDRSGCNFAELLCLIFADEAAKELATLYGLLILIKLIRCSLIVKDSIIIATCIDQLQLNK